MSKQATLVGTYPRKIDDKGRIAVPPEIRRALGKSSDGIKSFAVVNRQPEELRIYSKPEFKKLLKDNPDKKERLCGDSYRLTVETKPPYRTNTAKPLEALLGSSNSKERKVVIYGRGDYFAVVPDEDEK